MPDGVADAIQSMAFKMKHVDYRNAFGYLYQPIILSWNGLVP